MSAAAPSLVPAESPEARALADAIAMPERERLRDLAIRIANEAGELAVRRRREGVEVADVKSSPVDIVTAADREVEALVRARLAEVRPGDGFHGEESGTTVSETGLTWVVDPIDGTVNFLYGIPWFAVSIAVVAGDPSVEPAEYATIAGVVRNPAIGEEFVAVRGGGATLDGVPIRCNDAVEPAMSLVATGFNYDRDRRVWQADAWAGIAGEVRDLRRMGAAALDLCDVACGRVDLYYEAGGYPWDVAAGALVAREAGAVVMGEGGARESRRLILAGAPGSVERFAEFLPTSAVG